MATGRASIKDPDGQRLLRSTSETRHEGEREYCIASGDHREVRLKTDAGSFVTKALRHLKRSLILASFCFNSRILSLDARSISWGITAATVRHCIIIGRRLNAAYS